ncbi:hypothetical protein G3T36_06155 [Diaminobutyricibacter tongyongensis]|uniref:Uncharacterized protein n=1 Tax=Leifsonia tongyongensis TaxID=1268043 RepID=A0A6L9XVK6_9MICO|nr:hypothetical protein [Diaminobutyricibacter tongyongensis]NEN05449.1 hypothetical protein [Diaminobutyricibacter tongyongensis]
MKAARAWVLSAAAILVVAGATGVGAAVVGRAPDDSSIAQKTCFSAASFERSFPVRFSDIVVVDGSRTIEAWDAVQGWESHATIAQQIALSHDVSAFADLRSAVLARGTRVVAALMGELYGPKKAYVLCMVAVVDHKVTRGPLIEYTTPQ